jgi:hypothetical protein
MGHIPQTLTLLHLGLRPTPLSLDHVRRLVQPAADPVRGRQALKLGELMPASVFLVRRSEVSNSPQKILQTGWSPLSYLDLKRTTVIGHSSL